MKKHEYNNILKGVYKRASAQQKKDMEKENELSEAWKNFCDHFGKKYRIYDVVNWIEKQLEKLI